MIVRELAREAFRNVMSGASRAGIAAGSLFVVLMIAAGSAMLQSASLLRANQHFDAADADVIVMTAAGSVNGTACDRLTSRANIVAAGALSAPANLTYANLPDLTTSYYTASPGFASVIGASRLAQRSGSSAMLLEAGLARSIGARSGSLIDTSAGTVLVSGLYRFPDDGRATSIQSATIHVVASDRSFDQCWARVRPFNLAASAELTIALSTATPPTAQIAYRQANSDLGTSVDSADEFTERSTRFNALVALLISTTIAAGIGRMRRLELSSARHIGYGRADLAIQLGIEAALWAAPLAVASLSVTFLFADHISPADRATLYWISVPCVAAVCAGAVVGNLLAATSTRVGSLHEHFKDR